MLVKMAVVRRHWYRIFYIVLKACAYDPADRYSSAAEMLKDLNDEEPVVTPPPVKVEKKEIPVNAEPEKKEHVLRFIDDDGMLLASIVYNDGEKIAPPEVKEKQENGVIFEFDKWVPDVPDTAMQSMEFKAVYKKKVVPYIPPENPGVGGHKSKSVNKKVIAVAAAVMLAVGAFTAITFSGTNDKDVATKDPLMQDSVVEEENISQDSNISAEQGVKIEKVTLNSSSMTLIKGQNATLDFFVSPDGVKYSNARWTSADSSIVSVSNGKITALKSGKTKVSVEVEGKKAECVIEVTEKEISSVKISSEAQKKSYFVGDTISTKGLSLKVTYNNGDTETVSSGFGTQYDFSKSGTKQVVITYGNKNVTYNVEVKAPALSAISIASTPSKTNLSIGEAVSTSGLSLKLTYNNGSEKVVNSGFDYSPKSFSSSGKQTVTVKYEGKTTQFTVNIKEKQVVKMSISGGDRSYHIGDNFDSSGITVKVTYDDGSTEKVDISQCTLSNTKLRTSEGTHEIGVSYKGYSMTMNVQVFSPSVRIGVGNTGSGKMQLSALVIPEDGASVTWSSSDSSCVSISQSGMATAVGAGTAKITAKIKYNGVTYTDSVSLTVSESVQKTAGEIVESSTEMSTSDSLVYLRTDSKVTGYVYSHYCGYVNGVWNVDSCWVNDGSHYHTLETSSELAAGWIDGDRGGRAYEVKVGPGCTYNSTAWWLEGYKYSYTYVYQKYSLSSTLYFD